MATRKPQSSKSNSKRQTDPKPEPGKRDALEVRTESFRVAAGRETIEAFVVAFILALLFRGFLAEAFVIPTGSMAPTLMGAHKDIECHQCGTRFQVGASRERSGPVTHVAVVAGICPNCRRVNSLDLANNSNHATFNGDRIVVSKYSYALSEPDRWDVVVFKYPGNPKQNYIKRLVGMPNETLTLRHGDVYARTTGSDQQSEILRKPPRKLLAMQQLVYDTDYQSPALIKANYPSRWQPWSPDASSPPSGSWSIARDSKGLTATVDASADDRPHWLRYYHRWPTDLQWDRAIAGDSLADVDPYSSRLVSDFYAYDSYVNVPASELYDSVPTAYNKSSGVLGRVTGLFRRMMYGQYSNGVFSDRYRSGDDPSQFGPFTQWGGHGGSGTGIGRDGLHWVGDLLMEVDLETSDDARQAELELVEAGVRYRCRIDLQTGIATLSIDDGTARPFGDGSSERSAQTSVRGGSRHRLRFSNCDDQLLLWVGTKLVSFAEPTTFDTRDFHSIDENYPRYSPQHPLDASPAAIAVRGGTHTVHALKLSRDKYYIATKQSDSGIDGYDRNELWSAAGGERITLGKIQKVFGQPESWEGFQGWKARRSVTFELDEGQFFPMGDNSPESLDARCWAGTKAQIPMPRRVNEPAWRWSKKSYVPRELMVGKALVVFWPHSWNSPVPYIPNFGRMKFIR